MPSAIAPECLQGEQRLVSRRAPELAGAFETAEDETAYAPRMTNSKRGTFPVGFPYTSFLTALPHSTTKDTKHLAQRSPTNRPPFVLPPVPFVKMMKFSFQSTLPVVLCFFLLVSFLFGQQ